MPEPITRGPEQHLLAVYRRRLLPLVAVSVYLLLVVLTQYGTELHNPWFVLPNVGALVAWWFLFVRMLMAWDRLAAAQRR